MSGIEYRDGNIEAIYHAEGRAHLQLGAEAWIYEYSLRDHLGNTRLTFSDLNANGIVDVPEDILQEQHYYPFGMNSTFNWMNDAGLDDTKHLYNGKELSGEYGLNWMDYGARWYEPSLGRWWAIDPMAEKYPAWSPYNYTLNNPIMYVDPFGMDPFRNDIKEYGGASLTGEDAKRAFEELQQAEERGEIKPLVMSSSENESAGKLDEGGPEDPPKQPTTTTNPISDTKTERTAASVGIDMATVIHGEKAVGSISLLKRAGNVLGVVGIIDDANSAWEAYNEGEYTEAAYNAGKVIIQGTVMAYGGPIWQIGVSLVSTTVDIVETATGKPIYKNF